MRSYLDFEKPVAELEAKADELRCSWPKSSGSAAIAKEIEALEAKADAAAARSLCRADALAEDAWWRATRSGRTSATTATR